MNKKSIKKAILTVLIAFIGIFIFNIDAKAVNEVPICNYEFYDGVFQLYREYGTNDTYSYYWTFISDEENIGAIETVYEQQSKLFSNKNYVKSGDSKWNFKCKDNSEPCCPKIYYKSKKVDNITYYSIAPYKDSSKGITVEEYAVSGQGKINNDATGTNVMPTVDPSKPAATQTPNSSQKKYCSDAVVNSFIENYGKLLNTKCENKINELLKGLTTENWNDISNTYNSYVNDELIPEYLRIFYQINSNCTLANMDKNKIVEKFGEIATDILSKKSTEKVEEKVQTEGWSQEQASTAIANIQTSTTSIKEDMKSKIDSEVEKWNNLVETNSDGYKECKGLLGEDLYESINDIFTWLRILVPILLIVLGIVDFGKAIIVEEKDDLSKAVRTFAKRCVIAIIIFFIPTLIHVIVDIWDNVLGSPNGIRITDLKDCGIE